MTATAASFRAIFSSIIFFSSWFVSSILLNKSVAARSSMFKSRCVVSPSSSRFVCPVGLCYAFVISSQVCVFGNIASSAPRQPNDNLQHCQQQNYANQPGPCPSIMLPNQYSLSQNSVHIICCSFSGVAQLDLVEATDQTPPSCDQIGLSQLLNSSETADSC